MRQKNLFLCFLILLSCTIGKTFAQTIEVTAIENISTAKPQKTISVKLIDPLELSNEQFLNSGVILKGGLTDVVSPKRLKRDAGFSFKPKTYIDNQGKTHKLNLDITAKYTKPINKGQLAKSTALGVGSLFVKGLSTGVAAVEGAVKNEEGNRLKSSAKSVYKSSPLSYVEKGEDLYIQKGQTFFLKFPDGDDIEENTDQNNQIKGQNYSFTIEKE
jgi:hypothetical protein